VNTWFRIQQLNYLDGALKFLKMTASVLDPGQGNKQPEYNTVSLKQILDRKIKFKIVSKKMISSKVTFQCSGLCNF
jgi:hypothetical protein